MNKYELEKTVILIVQALLLSFLSSGTVLADIQSEEPFISELQIPGRIEGIGTYFEINNSAYLNVTLYSSESVKIALESVPEIVMMHIEANSGASSTLINLGGFLPSTTYHKYEDDFHNHTAFTTDASGNYTYTQDISKPHLIIIQPVPSTKFIRDDATGGDCISVGIWDAVTKTCTLTMDVYEVIQIDSNGVTLDGDGHTVKGSRPSSYWPGMAIFVYGKTGVTVKNLNAKSAWAGFYIYQSGGSTLINNTASSTSYGFYLHYSSGNTLINNTALNYGYFGINLENSGSNTLINNIASGGTIIKIGIRLVDSNGNTLINNTALNNPSNIGIYLVRSSFNNLINNFVANNTGGIILYGASSLNNLTNNTMSANAYNFWIWEGRTDSGFNNNIDTSNTVEGKPIYYVKNAINQIYDASTNAGTFYCINCSNVTIKGLNLSKNGAGIFLWRTQNSSIENNNISNNRYGIQLYHSSNIKVYNNNFVYNGWWYRSYYPQQAYAEGGSNNIFNLSSPVGGNYWNNYDEPVEGCNDADSNGFCDAPYIFSGGQDNLPWIKQSGWPSDNTPPTTIITLLGTQGNNGWYISDVQVTLSGTDNEGGSGVKNTDYSFDGTNWNLYTVPFTITNEGVTTVHYRSTDNAGNVELTKNQTIKIDKTPPAITGTLTTLPNANGWYNTDVTVHFTASDNVSGIDIVTPDTTIATEGTSQSVTGTAVDKAGNSASTIVSEINIDKTPPQIAINTPASEDVYLLNQALSADWSVTDALSGIASAAGTLPSGATIDTSTVGIKTFNVIATDIATNTATQTASYTITYNFLGILPPVKTDGSSIFKLGSTVPLKFRVANANGNYVSTAIASITYQLITNDILGTIEEAVSTSEANEGNTFRYDSTDNLYIFNLGTNGMTAGTYQLNINLDDGTSHKVRISLK